MAEWKSASLADLLPDSTADLLEAIGLTLLITVKTPLDVVSKVLTAVTVFATETVPILDIIKTVRENIETYKNDFNSSGIYLCSMVDYPLRQLQSKSSFGAEIDPKTGELVYQSEFSPEIDYSKIPSAGSVFETSFVQDLSDSFDDIMDWNAPYFQADCSMLIIVTGVSTISNLNFDLGENSFGQIFGEIGKTVGNMSAQIDRLKINADLALARSVAEKSSSNSGLVATRVKRVIKANHILSQLDNNKLSGLNIPFDPMSGQYGINQISPENVSWEVEIVPLLETLEDSIVLSEYPDWSRYSMKEFAPEIVQIVNEIFDPIIEFLKEAETLVKQILKLIKAIQEKVKKIQAIVYKIEYILSKIESILKSVGFHALFLTSKNGVSELQTKLMSATSVPFTGTGFYSGFALLAGGPPVTVFNLMLGPIGNLGG